MAFGDVLLIDLPDSDGREQSGRRPGIAVQADRAGEPLLMIAPVTSNLNAARYRFVLQINPSVENGLSALSVVMLFQMRALDKRRIVRRLGTLGADDLLKLRSIIAEMFA